MWHVTAGQDTNCFVCEHRIPPGSQCISDLPQQLPEGQPARLPLFSLGMSRIMGRRMDHPSPATRSLPQLRPERAKQEAVCLFCGHLILEGEECCRTSSMFGATVGDPTTLRTTGARAALLVALAKGRQVKPAPFLSQLSGRMQNKFQLAGLGRGRGGVRSPAAAQEFYRSSGRERPGRRPGKAFTSASRPPHPLLANAPGQARDSANIRESTKPTPRAAPAT